MANSVVIEPVANSVEVSLIDVTTITYFLIGSMAMEDHKEVGA